MRENKISLDRRVLRALVSDTRVDILKKLDERRRTITELSKELNLTKATVHEHLSKLSDAGLTRKDDDTRHRWVYYELSENGKEIFHPHERTKIEILIASASLAFFGGIFEIYRFVAEGIPLPPLKPGLPVLMLRDPAHLVVGLILAFVGTLLLYLALRIWRRTRALLDFIRSVKT